ncbi:hypothetical protein GCM10022221_45330 [Actinocorallia aurea]
MFAFSNAANASRAFASRADRSDVLAEGTLGGGSTRAVHPASTPPTTAHAATVRTNPTADLPGLEPTRPHRAHGRAPLVPPARDRGPASSPTPRGTATAAGQGRCSATLPGEKGDPGP